METIKGIAALQRAELISKMGGSFSISFFPFSRKKPSADPDAQLKTFQNCTMRLPLPRACYRVLIRYIGFSDENFKLYRVLWYE